jgi:hypothetical protein
MGVVGDVSDASFEAELVKLHAAENLAQGSRYGVRARPTVLRFPGAVRRPLARVR